MCLTIEVRPNQKTENEIGAISNSDGALFVSEVRSWLGKPTGNITISNDGEGCCACNMLTDDADLDGQYWDIHPECLTSLAITIEKLSGLYKKGFEFTALWAGDEIERTKKLSVQELIDQINANQIETKTK